jgi:hypothetical protein
MLRRLDTILAVGIRWRSLAAASLLFLPACDLGLSGEGGSAFGGEEGGASLGPTGYGPAPGAGDGSGPARDAAVGLDATTAVTQDGSSNGGSDSAAADASTVDVVATEAAVDDGGADASPIPAAIGAWSFDEGLGTQSADLSGNGHPAVFVGGASWGPGKVGTGLALDGMSGYADVGVPLVDARASFSVVAWARFASTNTWAVAVSEDDVHGSAFALKLRGDGTNDYDFDFETSDRMSPGFLVAQSTSTAELSVWVHLAGVYDASGKGALKVYVNGALEATTPSGQPFPAAKGHFVLGRGLYNGVIGSFFHGTLDEVAVYAGALSDGQISALFAGGP